MGVIPPAPTKTWTGEDFDDLDRRLRAVEQRLEHGAVPGGEIVTRIAALELERKLLSGVVFTSLVACCPMGVAGTAVVPIHSPWGPIEIHALEIVPLSDDVDRKHLSITRVRAGRFDHVNHGRCGDIVFPIEMSPGIEALITIENRALSPVSISLVYRYLDIETMKRAKSHG